MQKNSIRYSELGLTILDYSRIVFYFKLPKQENKTKYKNIKNRTKKVVANFMRKEAENELTKLNKKPNNIFTLVKFMKKMEKILKEVDA